MGHIEATRNLSATPDELWAIVSDPQSWDKWFTVHDKWLEEPPATLTSGARLTAKIVMLNMANKIEWTVKSVDAPTALALGAGFAVVAGFAILVAILVPALVAVAVLVALFGAVGRFLGLALGGLLGGQEGGGLGAGFVLEVDVEALVRLLARGDVREGPLRLERAQDAVIVLGVLLIVFGQHPVAAGGRIAGQLLIALVHGLGVAADLDVLGTLGVPGPVGIGVVRVVRPRLVAVAPTLTLHALEISHSRYRVQGRKAGSSRAGFRPFRRSVSLGADPRLSMCSECRRRPMVRRPFAEPTVMSPQDADSRARDPQGCV